MNYLLFLQAFQEKYKTIKDESLLFSHLREELQFLILELLFSSAKFPIYFMGATQLRLSYQLNRFSEDLDFSLDRPDSSFPSQKLFEILKKGFEEKTTGFGAHARINAKQTVKKIMMSFSKILFDLNLSPLKDESIKIKVELDTNPPAHAGYDIKQYKGLLSPASYAINTFDLSTGFAGKLGAILEREYQKGRDYFDLEWYLQRDPLVTINLDYFNANAKQQKAPTFDSVPALLKAVEQKLKTLDLSLLKKDLERFVMMPPDLFQKWTDNYTVTIQRLLTVYKNRL